MINDIYPFLDLTRVMLQLLAGLKEDNWQKTTVLGFKVDRLAGNLLLNHFKKSAKLSYLSDEVLKSNINQVMKKVESYRHELEVGLRLPQISDKRYCYCWLLQQCIRETVNNQDLLHPEFYSPFLKTVMQHLAYHYQQINAEKGTLIKVEIVGDAGGVWMIEKGKQHWQTTVHEGHPADVTVYLDQQIAWLLFSGALHLSEIGQFYQIIGNRTLGAHFLGMKTNLTASQLKDS